MGSGRLKSLLSPTSVVFLFFSSRVIIILKTAGLVLSPTVLPDSSPPFRLTTYYSSLEVVRPSDIALPQLVAKEYCSHRFHYADHIGCYVDCVDYADYVSCYQRSQLCLHSNFLW